MNFLFNLLMHEQAKKKAKKAGVKFSSNDSLGFFMPGSNALLSTISADNTLKAKKAAKSAAASASSSNKAVTEVANKIGTAMSAKTVAEIKVDAVGVELLKIDPIIREKFFLKISDTEIRQKFIDAGKP